MTYSVTVWVKTTYFRFYSMSC